MLIQHCAPLFAGRPRVPLEPCNFVRRRYRASRQRNKILRGGLETMSGEKAQFFSSEDGWCGQQEFEPALASGLGISLLRVVRLF
jgi:hypothetical protein